MVLTVTTKCVHISCALNGTNENGLPTLKSTASIFSMSSGFLRLRMFWSLQPTQAVKRDSLP